MPNSAAANATVRLPTMTGRFPGRSGGLRACSAVLLGDAVRAHRLGAILPLAAQDSTSERDPDLAEDLHRHDEPEQQQDDADQLADLEELCRAEPGERVRAARDERPERDEQRRRDAAVEPPGEERL